MLANQVATGRSTTPFSVRDILNLQSDNLLFQSPSFEKVLLDDFGLNPTSGVDELVNEVNTTLSSPNSPFWEALSLPASTSGATIPSSLSPARATTPQLAMMSPPLYTATRYTNGSVFTTATAPEDAFSNTGSFSNGDSIGGSPMNGDVEGDFQQSWTVASDNLSEGSDGSKKTPPNGHMCLFCQISGAANKESSNSDLSHQRTHC